MTTPDRVKGGERLPRVPRCHGPCPGAADAYCTRDLSSGTKDQTVANARGLSLFRQEGQDGDHRQHGRAGGAVGDPQARALRGRLHAQGVDDVTWCCLDRYRSPKARQSG
jgi:hypothetical protein